MTSNSDKMGLRYKPMVFTEQGVAILLINNNLQLTIYPLKFYPVDQFRIVFEAITQLIEEDEKPKKNIGYINEGQSKVALER